jgi:predicted transcriptional regulator of viral defense system
MIGRERSTLSSFALGLLAAGRSVFSADEAQQAIGVGRGAFLDAAERLQRRGRLLRLRRGFYVVVPPQFHSWEAPPPSWYIDDLMRHEGRPYYVGLLKAAELHGATHHAVMEFQVVTDRQIPRIRAGRSFITFHFRKDIQPVLSAVESRKTDTGSMKVSSVELTVLDLVRYAHAAGGIDAAATALVDLGGKIDGGKLAAIAGHFERATVQRLGYLLDRLGHEAAAHPLHRQLFARPSVPWVKLEPAGHKGGVSAGEPAERNERWRVEVQRHPETEE